MGRYRVSAEVNSLEPVLLLELEELQQEEWVG